MRGKTQTARGSIGIFDSGYGGLTVLREIVRELPDFDYLYLGDNARAPYGTRSFPVIYEYTLQAVKYLFGQNCPLIILACNTASARALRNIQQKDLPHLAPQNRVLGVIRPTAEVIGDYSRTGHIGVLGTPGTVKSESYLLEIAHHSPAATVTQQACPLWVPLVENGELKNAGADFFVGKNIRQLFRKNPAIDTILLGCTHYPLLLPLIEKNVPQGVRVTAQGEIVAASLADYLQRHPEMSERLSRTGQCTFLTTGDAADFAERGKKFYGEKITARQIHL